MEYRWRPGPNGFALEYKPVPEAEWQPYGPVIQRGGDGKWYGHGQQGYATPQEAVQNWSAYANVPIAQYNPQNDNSVSEYSENSGFDSSGNLSPSTGLGSLAGADYALSFNNGSLQFTTPEGTVGTALLPDGSINPNYVNLGGTVNIGGQDYVIGGDLNRPTINFNGVNVALSDVLTGGNFADSSVGYNGNVGGVPVSGSTTIGDINMSTDAESSLGRRIQQGVAWLFDPTSPNFSMDTFSNYVASRGEDLTQSLAALRANPEAWFTEHAGDVGDWVSTNYDNIEDSVREGWNTITGQGGEQVPGGQTPGNTPGGQTPGNGTAGQTININNGDGGMGSWLPIVLGGILGLVGGNDPAGSTTTTTTGASGQSASLWDRLLPGLTSQIDTGLPGYQDAINGAVGQLSPQVMAAFSTLLQAPDVANNPYFAPLLEAAVRPIGEQLTRVALPAIKGGAVAAGGLGGSRQGIAEGLAIQGAQNATADVGARLAADFNQQGLAASGSALGQIPNLYNLATAGARAPMDWFSNMTGVAGRAPGNTTTVRTDTDPNTWWQNLLSGAMGGAGVADLFRRPTNN